MKIECALCPVRERKLSQSPGFLCVLLTPLSTRQLDPSIFCMLDATHQLTEQPREDREEARAARRKIISQLEEAKIRYQSILADPNADENSLEQARVLFSWYWNEAIRIQNNLQKAQDSYSRAVDNVRRARDTVKEARENISQAVEACYKGFLGS